MLSEVGLSESEVAPRRFHPLTVFFDVGAFLRRAALPMIVALVRAPSAADIILPAILVIGFGGRLLAWQRRTYSVEGGVLRLDEGVLQRRHRAVPLDRIQQVDVHRSLRHRVFGVATLRVETAGDAGGPEIELNVVGLAEVERLRGLLLAARRPVAQDGSQTEGDGHGGSSRRIVALGVGEVSLAGITGAHLGVMLTILFWPLQLLDDIPGNQLEDFDPSAFSATVGQLLLVAIVLVPLWLTLAAAASLLRDAGFTLDLDGDEIVVRRGLLERREAHVALTRIQMVQINQGLLRRPLGMVTMRIQSAGGSGDASKVSIPILPAAAVERILTEVLPGAAPLPRLTPAPPAAGRRRRTRGVVAGLVAASLFGVAAAAPVATLLVAGLAAAGGWVLGGVWYRALGYGTSPGFVIARRGAISRRTVIVPTAKVQSTRVRSSPFQRAAGLATAYLDVAARGTVPTVADQSTETARYLAATGR